MTISKRIESPHCWDELIGEDERLVSMNYSGLRRVRGRRALLMIDLYNRVFGDRPEPLRESMRRYPSSCGLAGWQALPAQQALLAVARRAGRPVVHTVANEANAVSGDSATLRVRNGDRPEQPDHGPGWDNAIVEPLRPVAGELVVGKDHASAFFGTSLDRFFRANGVESLVIVGESTSGCVRASVVDAYSLGFDVVVAEQAVFDRSLMSHRMSLFDLHLKYATVVDTETTALLLSSTEPAELDVVMGPGQI